MFTNGTLLTSSRLKFLKENSITTTVSIDGKRKVQDFNRPFKRKTHLSSYDSITGNLKQLNWGNYSYNIYSSLVFTPFSVGGLLKDIKSLRNLGFSCINFSPNLYSQWSNDDLNKAELVFREFSDFYISTFEKSKGIFKNSLLGAFVRGEGLYKPVLCQKIHLDWKGNFYCCDKVLSIAEPERKKFIIGDTRKGINNRLRINLLEQIRKEIRELTGKDCNECKYLKYCFCPIGQYIYFSSCGLDFKRYFLQFCRLSEIYIKSLLEIKARLSTNPLFEKLYAS